MLAELVQHVIGVDPDRDWITLAVVDARTTGVIAQGRFRATAGGYADAIDFVDGHCIDSERAWAIEGTAKSRAPSSGLFRSK
jgi:transposase